MSKARTLADFISDGSEFADGTISVAEVSGAAPLASPTFTGNIDVGDNVRIRLGDSDDLQIYHDGANNQIHSTVGHINVTASGDDKDIIFYSDDGSGGTTAYLNVDGSEGAVKLRHYGDLKLRTRPTGVEITGDVGGDTATITGKTTTDELDLNALAATISDTAVDIFVYDTRKDSDGGAWRKRTQHTSWYNEAASSTRGSRKEFPAVAVIVANDTADTVTIYDGDDPDLPMWMVFEAGNNSNYRILANNTALSLKSVKMLNGLLVVGGSASASISGVYKINFLLDNAYLHRDAAFAGGPSLKNISQRNDTTFAGYGTDSAPFIVNDSVNDVAMTVLPNAPIDAATGLPVPTIAVGTDAGASVITDSGSVYDISSTADGVQIAFDDDKKLWVMWNDASGDAIYAYPVSAYTSGDFTNADGVFRFNDGGWSSGKQGNSFDFDQLAVLSNNYIAFGGNYSPADYEGLNIHNDVAYPGAGTELEPEALHANIQSDFSTGWMNGDIKLATLSDTDDTDVTGSELVTNGTFDSDTSGWTAAFSTLSVTSGTLQVVGTGNFNYATQTVTGLTVGKKYVFQADIVTGSGNTYIYVRRGDNGGGIDNGSANGVGSYALTFEAPTTSVEIRLYQIYQTTSTFDNVSIRLAEEDRSANNNGLQVFGTITKDPVATGADLVGYSGFSGTTNYLEQPVNSDLTGAYDSCFMGWMKTSSTSQYQYIFSLGSSNSDVFGLAAQITTGYLYAYDDVNGLDASSTNVADGVWHHVCLVHKNGVNKQLYVDGRLISTFTTSSYTHSNDVKYRVGQYYTSNYPWQGSLALQRFSKTIPSPEQIKKIYEDEKVLFQENAQATLYGSSDAVTALAYDDSTNLLHVGTSAGRSVFQGLRRVDNTTTAVGAAISASNGLVADE